MDGNSEAEIPLGGGWSTAGVVRLGGTVRRPLKPNAPFVHKLLAHLEAVGFHEAPALLGVDQQEREILSYVEGEVPSDCRALVWEDGQLEASARLLRRFHDATAGSELAGNHEVVCHNDYGPWNLVWIDGAPVAIIDFDLASPGRRSDDLGYAAWKHLNLGLVSLPVAEQRRRLAVVAAAYGAPADDELVRAIDRAQERMERFLEDHDPAPDSAARRLLEGEREWFRASRHLLLAERPSSA